MKEPDQTAEDVADPPEDPDEGRLMLGEERSPPKLYMQWNGGVIPPFFDFHKKF